MRSGAARDDRISNLLYSGQGGTKICTDVTNDYEQVSSRSKKVRSVAVARNRPCKTPTSDTLSKDLAPLKTIVPDSQYREYLKDDARSGITPVGENERNR